MRRSSGRSDLSRLDVLGLLHQFELAVEVSRSVEIFVDAGETEVRDFVNRAQLLQHSEPNIGRRNLGALQANRIFDGHCELFEGLGRHRATLGRCSKASNQFLASEQLGPTVRLDNRELRMINAFKRGETMGASKALTAPSDGGVLFGDA